MGTSLEAFVFLSFHIPHSDLHIPFYCSTRIASTGCILAAMRAG